MIYTVISNLKENRIEAKSRDCRIIRQPLGLLPESIKRYIENTKNQATKEERQLAYTTLLCALKAFFDIENPNILREEHGKPYLETGDIHISLSHSDGAVAVCLCDEGAVGIDLQSDISEDKAKRLKKRFFTDFQPENERLDTEFYFCKISEAEAIIESIDRPDTVGDSFTAKWTAAEALMKLHGQGFADASKLDKIGKNAKTEIFSLTIDKSYTLAIAVEVK